jgi:hypothetical protein
VQAGEQSGDVRSVFLDRTRAHDSNLDNLDMF